LENLALNGKIKKFPNLGSKMYWSKKPTVFFQKSRIYHRQFGPEITQKPLMTAKFLISATERPFFPLELSKPSLQ